MRAGGGYFIWGRSAGLGDFEVSGGEGVFLACLEAVVGFEDSDAGLEGVHDVAGEVSVPRKGVDFHALSGRLSDSELPDIDAGTDVEEVPISEMECQKSPIESNNRRTQQSSLDEKS